MSKSCVISVSPDTKDRLDLARIEWCRWKKTSYDKFINHVLNVYDNAMNRKF